MSLHSVQENGFLACFRSFILVPGTIRYLFDTLLTEELERVSHCGSAIWVCLGRPHKEPVKGPHLGRGRSARKSPERPLRRGVRFRVARFGPIFTEFRFWDSPRKDSSHRPVKIFLPYSSRPHAPRAAPPSSESECANKGFQASVGKTEGKAEVSTVRAVAALK